MRRTIPLLMSWALVAVLAVAQPTVHRPNFDVSLQATGIQASGESMAVDWRDNVYILDIPNPSPFPPPHTITKVSRNGQVTPGHVSGLGVLSQIAYNPADGHCYVAAHSPLLPVVLSTVYRIEPGGGATQVGNVTLIAQGLTIDDRGRFIFGTQTAPQGAGLYRWRPGSFALTYLGPGFGQNRILQSLADSSDVLIGEGLEVRRWTPFTIVPVPYWSFPITPNALVRVTSLARSPMNQLGIGSLIGVHERFTLCLQCGTGYAFPGDRTSGANAPFASENWNAPFRGLRTIASGIRQDLVWLTDGPSPAPSPGKLLWRVSQLPAPGSQGSLIAEVLPSPTTTRLLAFHVHGPAAGGDPFLLGTIPLGIAPYPVSTNMMLFLPPAGWIMNIFHPAYIPLLDGVGVFGPPNPFAVIPPGGHFVTTISTPPLGGFAFMLQALILSDDAPNGLFFISNLDTLVVP